MFVNLIGEKMKKIIVCFIVMSYFIYSFMTPVGSVRLSVLLAGYPIEAITGHLKEDKEKHSESLKSNQKAYIFKNPPIEKGTEGILDRWVAEKYGLFYVSGFNEGI